MGEQCGGEGDVEAGEEPVLPPLPMEEPVLPPLPREEPALPSRWGGGGGRVLPRTGEFTDII